MDALDNFDHFCIPWFPSNFYAPPYCPSTSFCYALNRNTVMSIFGCIPIPRTSSFLECLDSSKSALSFSKMSINCKVQYLNDLDPFSTCIFYLEPPRGLSFTLSVDKPINDQILLIHKILKPPFKAEDSALQIYRNDYSNQSDYGSYLDSDLSLSEQPDELAVLKDGRKNSLVLRTQLTTRVKIILGKLLNSKGKDLRRVLFSLKQIFQDDKDLVHEFVQNDGLACLRRVNSDVEQTYQNYILRAVGQVMLYVDGMNGVIAHNETVQWLYSLLGSQYRLVVKTALKLLLVFVEYTESNALLLLAAVYLVDRERSFLSATVGDSMELIDNLQKAQFRSGKNPRIFVADNRRQSATALLIHFLSYCTLDLKSLVAVENSLPRIFEQVRPCKLGPKIFSVK
uniref:GBD/FH3 domain-containing protein n=1 Tax=Romanomermis culicivorax TaxID=13658 RepID=A0A915I7X2_ROMCU